jgi:tRNA threonylcarbamoyladenosine biosynthesis protein TsaE
MRTFETHTEEETVAAGREIGALLPSRCIVLLEGNLGAGKTTITRGIAEALGEDGGEVSSPTFTLIHEYGRRLAHADLYRLESDREFFTLGLEEYFDRDCVVLIEWGGKFRHLLPASPIELLIEHLGEDNRRITLKG